MLMYDLLEGEIDEQFYIPFNMYSGGSYFGDSDVLHDLPRDGTALVETECNLFAMTRKDVLSVIKRYKNTIGKDMYRIADERRKHHKEAIEELILQNKHIKRKKIKQFKDRIGNSKQPRKRATKML